MNEQFQVFSVSATLVMNWVDPDLTWDPKLNGNLTRLTTVQEDTWLPDIVVANSANARSPLGYVAASTKVPGDAAGQEEAGKPSIPGRRLRVG